MILWKKKSALSCCSSWVHHMSWITVVLRIYWTTIQKSSTGLYVVWFKPAVHHLSIQTRIPVRMISGSCKFPACRSTCCWCFHNFVYNGANQVLDASGHCFPVNSKWLSMFYTDSRRMKPNECATCKKCMLCFFLKVFFICVVCNNVCFMGDLQYITLLCAVQWKWVVCVSSYSSQIVTQTMYVTFTSCILIFDTEEII